MLARPTKHARRGFSLIEILVVLSLLVLAAGIVLPTVTSIRDQNLVDQVVVGIEEGLSEARAEALRLGTTITLRLSPTRGGWELVAVDTSADPEQPRRISVLPSGVLPPAVDDEPSITLARVAADGSVEPVERLRLTPPPSGRGDIRGAGDDPDPDFDDLGRAGDGDRGSGILVSITPWSGAVTIESAIVGDTEADEVDETVEADDFDFDLPPFDGVGDAAGDGAGGSDGVGVAPSSSGVSGSVR